MNKGACSNNANSKQTGETKIISPRKNKRGRLISTC